MAIYSNNYNLNYTSDIQNHFYKILSDIEKLNTIKNYMFKANIHIAMSNILKDIINVATHPITVAETIFSNCVGKDKEHVTIKGLDYLISNSQEQVMVDSSRTLKIREEEEEEVKKETCNNMEDSIGIINTNEIEHKKMLIELKSKIKDVIDSIEEPSPFYKFINHIRYVISVSICEYDHGYDYWDNSFVNINSEKDAMIFKKITLEDALSYRNTLSDVIHSKNIDKINTIIEEIVYFVKKYNSSKNARMFCDILSGTTQYIDKLDNFIEMLESWLCLIKNKNIIECKTGYIQNKCSKHDTPVKADSITKVILPNNRVKLFKDKRKGEPVYNTIKQLIDYVEEHIQDAAEHTSLSFIVSKYLLNTLNKYFILDGIALDNYEDNLTVPEILQHVDEQQNYLNLIGNDVELEHKRKEFVHNIETIITEMDTVAYAAKTIYLTSFDRSVLHCIIETLKKDN